MGRNENDASFTRWFCTAGSSMCCCDPVPCKMRHIFWHLISICHWSIQILPKKDLATGSISWDTSVGKQCTRTLRRLLMKPEAESFVFVSVTFLRRENWWPLQFVDMIIDGQVKIKEKMPESDLLSRSWGNEERKTRIDLIFCLFIDWIWSFNHSPSNQIKFDSIYWSNKFHFEM